MDAYNLSIHVDHFDGHKLCRVNENNIYFVYEI